MIEKSEDTNTRLLILMSNSFLFKSLDQKDADIVKGAMEERFFKAGDYVIK
jgi:cAMP-dependent protein kinase regulator